MTFGPFSLFVDLYSECYNIQTLSDYFSPFKAICQASFEHKQVWAPPICKYDLLIVDYNYICRPTTPLETYTDYYEAILVVNAPKDETALNTLLQAGISHWLTEDATRPDWIAFIQNHIHMRKIAYERAILDKLIHSAQNTVVITDTNGNIEYANPYFEKVSGYRTHEFISRSPNIIKSGLHDDAFYKTLWETITQKKVWEGIFVNKTKKGDLFYEEATISPILNHHNELDKFLKIGKNITKERMLLDELSSEVKLARKVIDALLPKNHKDSRIHLQYELRHHNEIGGDFVFFQKSNDYKYNFAIIDVMGHGVSAALIAITTMQMFADYMEFSSLETSVAAVNRFLCEFNNTQEDRGLFITGTFVSFDFKAQTAKLINAGHNDTLAIKHDGRLDKLHSNNILLGVINGHEFELYTFNLKKYSHLFFFTDGLYEHQGLEYNDAVKQIGSLLTVTPPTQVVKTILNHFNPEGDDVTVANITLNGLL